MATKTDATIKKGGSFLLEETSPADVFTPEDFNDEQRMFVKTADDSFRTKSSPTSSAPSTRKQA
jgi:hypothetical protein